MLEPRLNTVFCLLVCAYWDLDPPFVLFFSDMPPKKKAAEVRTDVEVEGEALESEFSVSSPASVASTASAMSGASTEFLEKILEANQRSMAALIAALPSMLATPASSATVPKSARVDVRVLGSISVNTSRPCLIMECLRRSGVLCFRFIYLAVRRRRSLWSILW